MLIIPWVLTPKLSETESNKEVLLWNKLPRGNIFCHVSYIILLSVTNMFIWRSSRFYRYRQSKWWDSIIIVSTGRSGQRVETICQMERITHERAESRNAALLIIFRPFFTISERVFSQIIATILTAKSQRPLSHCNYILNSILYLLEFDFDREVPTCGGLPTSGKVF